MTLLKTSLHMLLRCTMFIVLATALVACGDEEDTEEPVTTDTDPAGVSGTNPSPQAANRQPEGVEGFTLEITDGAFSPDEVRLVQGEPTTLTIVNEDDEAYRFQIESLVAPQDIPAGDTTKVEFTTPDDDEYTGQLLAADDDTVIAEVSVIVQGAGGIVD